MLALKAVQLPNLLIMQQELARTVLLTVIHAQMQTLAPYVPQIGSWIQVQINAHKPVQPNSSEIQEQEHVRHALLTAIPVQVEVSVPLVHQLGSYIQVLVLKIVQLQLLLTHQ